jgi:hypothetical protein
VTGVLVAVVRPETVRMTGCPVYGEERTNVRALIRRLAEDAGVHNPAVVALQIQMLLLGATVAAVYGDLDGAQQAREVASLLLEREGIPTEA